MVKFTQGDTVQLDTFWKDRNNSDINPASQTLTIKDSAGIEILSTTSPMLCSGCVDCTGTGHYYVDHDLANDCKLGVYTVKWVATITGKEKILVDTFEVEKYSLRPT